MTYLQNITNLNTPIVSTFYKNNPKNTTLNNKIQVVVSRIIALLKASTLFFLSIAGFPLYFIAPKRYSHLTHHIRDSFEQAFGSAALKKTTSFQEVQTPSHFFSTTWKKLKKNPGLSLLATTLMLACSPVVINYFQPKISPIPPTPPELPLQTESIFPYVCLAISFVAITTYLIHHKNKTLCSSSNNSNLETIEEKNLSNSPLNQEKEKTGPLLTKSIPLPKRKKIIQEERETFKEAAKASKLLSTYPDMQEFFCDINEQNKELVFSEEKFENSFQSKFKNDKILLKNNHLKHGERKQHIKYLSEKAAELSNQLNKKCSDLPYNDRTKYNNLKKFENLLRKEILENITNINSLIEPYSKSECEKPEAEEKQTDFSNLQKLPIKEKDPTNFTSKSEHEQSELLELNSKESEKFTSKSIQEQPDKTINTIENTAEIKSKFQNESSNANQFKINDLIKPQPNDEINFEITDNSNIESFKETKKLTNTNSKSSQEKQEISQQKNENEIKENESPSITLFNSENTSGPKPLDLSEQALTQELLLRSFEYKTEEKNSNKGKKIPFVKISQKLKDKQKKREDKKNELGVKKMPDKLIISEEAKPYMKILSNLTKKNCTEMIELFKNFERKNNEIVFSNGDSSKKINKTFTTLVTALDEEFEQQYKKIKSIKTRTELFEAKECLKSEINKNCFEKLGASSDSESESEKGPN